MEGHHSISLSVCLSVCLSFSLLICLYVCQSVCLSFCCLSVCLSSYQWWKLSNKCTRQKLSNKSKLEIPYCIYNLLFNAGRGLSSTSSSYVIQANVSQFSLSYQTWERAQIGTVPQEGWIKVEPVDYHKDVTSQFTRLEKLILNFSSSLIAIHVYLL